ncbi:MAG: hypothetical protein AAGB27_05605, partial [Pseudomonadota bacterium]
RSSRDQQRDHLTELRLIKADGQRCRQDLKDISGVVKGHLGQSMDQRQRQTSLESRVALLETRHDGKEALEDAKNLLSEGRSLNALVQRGKLNPSEAHLLSLLHRKGSGIDRNLAQAADA